MSRSRSASPSRSCMPRSARTRGRPGRRATRTARRGGTPASRRPPATRPSQAARQRDRPEARRALLRTSRRSLQMVLRLLAHNAEHWLSRHLNAYLRDDDEYRAITRETIIRGLAGTITCTTAAITVTLDQPGTPAVTQALRHLLDEINHNPPNMPGDTRPITYQLASP